MTLIRLVGEVIDTKENGTTKLLIMLNSSAQARVDQCVSGCGCFSAIGFEIEVLREIIFHINAEITISKILAQSCFLDLQFVESGCEFCCACTYENAFWICNQSKGCG